VPPAVKLSAIAAWPMRSSRSPGLSDMALSRWPRSYKPSAPEGSIPGDPAVRRCRMNREHEG